jgi:hypothetical protein
LLLTYEKKSANRAGPRLVKIKAKHTEMNSILINVCICLKYIEVKGKVSRHTHTKKGLVQICPH